MTAGEMRGTRTRLSVFGRDADAHQARDDVWDAETEAGQAGVEAEKAARRGRVVGAGRAGPGGTSAYPMKPAVEDGGAELLLLAKT